MYKSDEKILEEFEIGFCDTDEDLCLDYADVKSLKSFILSLRHSDKEAIRQEMRDEIVEWINKQGGLTAIGDVNNVIILSEDLISYLKSIK